jgi:pimeloyl-ACP methyl ester carboxylesterase
MTMASAMPIDRPALGEVDVDDGRLPIAIAGGGPSLILLHGWTLDHRMWRPQHAGLGAHYRLIMPDRRGFGRATAPPDLMREAEDVVRIADALGLDRFALAGLSQGAAVALDVARRFPDRIEAAALSGTPLPGLVPDPDRVPRDEFAAMARDGALAWLRKAWLADPLMQVANDEGRALLGAIIADYDARDLPGGSAIEPFSREAIATLPMPLLAVAGSHESPWRVACARLLAETAPKGRFMSIANAGHIANVDQPDAFNAALIAFFGEHFSPLS